MTGLGTGRTLPEPEFYGQYQTRDVSVDWLCLVSESDRRPNWLLGRQIELHFYAEPAGGTV